MSAPVEIKLVGVEEYQRAAGDASHALLASVIRPVVNRAAQNLLSYVRAEAAPHRKTGDLDRAIRVHLAVTGKSVVAELGINEQELRGSRYPFILEFGSDAHVIRPRRGRALLIHGDHFAGVVHHPDLCCDELPVATCLRRQDE